MLKEIMKDKFFVRTSSEDIAQSLRLKIMKEYPRYWVCVFIIEKGFGIEVTANGGGLLPKDELADVKLFFDKACKVKKIQKTLIKETDPVLS